MMYEMNRERLEEMEQELILRYLDLDEEAGSDEAEQVRQKIAAVQVSLMHCGEREAQRG